jgi:hypothetical protein
VVAAVSAVSRCMMLVWKFVGLSYGCEDWFGHRHICSDVFRALGVLLRVPWICEYQFAPTLIVLYEIQYGDESGAAVSGRFNEQGARGRRTEVTLR